MELHAVKEDAVQVIRLFDDTHAENNLKHKLLHIMEKCAVKAIQTHATQSELKAELAVSKQKKITHYTNAAIEYQMLHSVKTRIHVKVRFSQVPVI